MARLEKSGWETVPEVSFSIDQRARLDRRPRIPPARPGRCSSSRSRASSRTSRPCCSTLDRKARLARGIGSRAGLAGIDRLEAPRDRRGPDRAASSGGIRGDLPTGVPSARGRAGPVAPFARPVAADCRAPILDKCTPPERSSPDLEPQINLSRPDASNCGQLLNGRAADNRSTPRRRRTTVWRASVKDPGRRAEHGSPSRARVAEPSTGRRAEHGSPSRARDAEPSTGRRAARPVRRRSDLLELALDRLLALGVGRGRRLGPIVGRALAVARGAVIGAAAGSGPADGRLVGRGADPLEHLGELARPIASPRRGRCP